MITLVVLGLFVIKMSMLIVRLLLWGLFIESRVIFVILIVNVVLIVNVIVNWMNVIVNWMNVFVYLIILVYFSVSVLVFYFI